MTGAWLNGWPLLEGSHFVLIGSGVHCAGCGRDFGVTCVVVDPDWPVPDTMPDWPFAPDGCPLCAARLEAQADQPPPSLAERLAAFKAARADLAKVAEVETLIGAMPQIPHWIHATAKQRASMLAWLADVTAWANRNNPQAPA